MDEFCTEIVRRAGEDPQPCGLERPCPKHDDDHEPRRPQGMSGAEWASIFFGERRDV